MLVVTRRPGESVLIGGDVEVFVLAVDGAQVRVGINAPRAVRVLRRELLTQVESENRRAVGTSLGRDDLSRLLQPDRSRSVRAT
jgi:carbon storage regulator